MSECKLYNEKIWLDYLQNKLDQEEEEAAQFHLLNCPQCRAKLERMRSMVEAMAQEPISAKGIPFWLNPVFRVAATVGLLLVLSVSGFYLINTSSEKKELPIEIVLPPVYHSSDSVRTEPDSIEIVHQHPDSIKKERE